MTIRYSAPGRVNLIGEHTDYNDGLALPLAITAGVTVHARSRGARTIVARALGVPAVSDIPNISEIVENDDALIVDGLTGEVHLLPPPEVEAAYAEKARLRARRQDQYRALRDTPATSVIVPSARTSAPSGTEYPCLSTFTR